MHSCQVRGGEKILETLLGEGYGRLAVPMFLLISGYLFFPSKEKQFNKDAYIYKLKRRAKSLLVPYLLWNLLAYILYAIDYSFNIVDFFKSFWVIEVPGRGGSSPIDGPLWYVRNLMILMIASPLIYLISKHKVFTLLLLFLWLIGLPPFNKGMLIALTFFSLGGWLRYESFSVNRIHGVWFSIIFAMSLFSLPFINSNIFPYVQRIMILTGILTLLSIAKKLPDTDNKVYQILASATFFIYCCHDILLNYLKPIAMQVSTSWWSYLLLITLDLTGCLLLFFIVTKIFPRYSKLLTGGR